MSRFLVEEKDLSIHDSHIYDQRVRYRKEQAKKDAKAKGNDDLAFLEDGSFGANDLDEEMKAY